MGKIFDEVNEKVFNTNTDFEELQGLCIDLATRLEKAEQQGLSAGNAGYKAVADIIEECASICERPFYKLAPSMVEINPESHEPINQLISQRDLFSFINDIIKLRTNEIRKLKATAFITTLPISGHGNFINQFGDRYYEVHKTNYYKTP